MLTVARTGLTRSWGERRARNGWLRVVGVWTDRLSVGLLTVGELFQGVRHPAKRRSAMASVERAAYASVRL